MGNAEYMGVFSSSVAMASPQQICKMFLDHYYNCSNTKNWSALGNLYTNDSMLSFEGQEIKGAQGILEKLQVRIRIHRVDVPETVLLIRLF